MAEAINDPNSNSQNEAAANSTANAGVQHGVTETDSQGNFTGAGSTSPKANDPVVNRDAVAPEIQKEKPETNVPRSSEAGIQTELGNAEMRVVPPANIDQENVDAVNKAREDAAKVSVPTSKKDGDK